MNALELTWFPDSRYHTTALERAANGSDRCAACVLEEVGDLKRLTDAELAAEYHASLASANFALSEGLPWVEEMARHNTLAKFATHPHYDEKAAS